MILDAIEAQGTPLEDGDIVVVTQKVVSKAEGRTVDLADVEPSDFARQFAGHTGRDPRLVELVLRESIGIVRMDQERGILITETRHGFVCANSGIDSSNVVGDEAVTLLPEDPDRSARRLMKLLRRDTGLSELAVIITDTFGRAWREGHVNFAIGIAGMDPFMDYRGQPDAQSKVMGVTRIAIADEIAAASELVMGEGRPGACCHRKRDPIRPWGRNCTGTGQRKNCRSLPVGRSTLGKRKRLRDPLATAESCFFVVGLEVLGEACLGPPRGIHREPVVFATKLVEGDVISPARTLDVILEVPLRSTESAFAPALRAVWRVDHPLMVALRHLCHGQLRGDLWVQYRRFHFLQPPNV